MSSLKRSLEKVWFSLLLTTLIIIGVSRVFRSDNEFLAKSPRARYTATTTNHTASSGRPATKPLNSLENENQILSNDHNVIFFNRVPKTGSEMLVLLIQWMQGINGFRHVRLPGGNKRRLQPTEQRLMVEDVWAIVKRESVPVSFDRHVYFTNFTQFSSKTPIFINIVRDPVDKAVSRYYYGRVTPNPLNPDIKFARSTTTSKPRKNDNFERCHETGDPECAFYSGQPYDLTIPYFCGHYRQCMILNDRWALARAKNNIEEYFPVIGVLENINATLSVLEEKLPRFFNGVSNMYYHELLEPHRNKNRWRPRQIDPKIRTMLETQLSAEYDLYRWISARLARQASEIAR